ncbi:MAG: ABC transporter substrate-binding protein [Sphingobium sp.]|nr:MAG: ABC transporter substrate-binding protein [Sphingobium sp.]
MLLLGACARAAQTQDTAPRGTPMRIVSMNPCVDAVLRDVAAPEQIAAVSRYSHDQRATSVPRDWALRYPANDGSAEDVIAARPDLVITGPHVAVQTVAALKRLGIPLMQVAVPETVAENKAQIAAIAARIGRVEAGRALSSRIDAELVRSRWTGRATSALIWQGSGLVPGTGTLADELLTHAGFRNLSPELGLGKWDILPLEGLFLNPPKVLLAGRADMSAGDGDANRMLSHPALRKAESRFRIEDYPSNLLHCGGPVILRSLARLANVRRELEQRP